MSASAREENRMKIGLISDTHAPALGVHPPIEVERALAGVDLILHAGDIYSADCLDWLERLAPVIAVEVAPAPVIGDPRVAERRVISLKGYAVGLVHDLAIRGVDEVQPGHLARAFPEPERLHASLHQFFEASVDVVVFGHTHYALAERHHGVLFVNPGSPTLPRQTRRLGQVAILDLSGPAPEAEIIELSTLV